MKIVKFNEMHYHFDPFGEEDWEERDMFLFGVVLWVGARTQRCELRIAHVDKKIEGSYILLSINGVIINKNKLSRYQSTMGDSNYYSVNGKILIFDVEKLNETTIKDMIDTMTIFIKTRIISSQNTVDRYERVIDEEGYDEENDEYWDLGESRDVIKKENKIIENLKKLKKTVDEFINDEIKKLKSDEIS